MASRSFKIQIVDDPEMRTLLDQRRVLELFAHMIICRLTAEQRMARENVQAPDTTHDPAPARPSTRTLQEVHNDFV